MNPAIGNLATTRPPTNRAMTDVPARNSTANDAVLLSVRSSARRTSCWIAPTCEPSTNRYPSVTATKKRVRTASAYAVPYASGRGEPCDERSPSGSQPSIAGSGRTSQSAKGTVPSTKTSPSTGVPASSPRSSSSHFAAGVSRMPPTDSPVDATDSATDRRRWNHRVMTVVVGTIPAPVHPTANTP